MKLEHLNHLEKRFTWRSSRLKVKASGIQGIWVNGTNYLQDRNS